METVPEKYDELFINFLCEHWELHDLGRATINLANKEPDIQEKVERFYAMSLLPL